jgi:L-phenylalanine/L-methionine N-acetyltransferase
MELGNKEFLGCFVNEKLIGVASVERFENMHERCKHIGSFGMSISSLYRGEGIGYEFAQATIEISKKHISGMKMITLEVFATNEVAQNLYKKLGFTECGRIPKGILHRKEYVDEIKMYLEIN